MLEEKMAELTAALKENTAAHLKLAAVAEAASKGGSGGTTKTTETPSDKAPTAAEKKAAAAAEKAAADKAAAAKAAADKKKANTAPTLAATVDAKDLREAARTYLEGNDESEREAKKANVKSGFDHLGVTKLTELESDEDRARLAGYIAYWAAGLEVEFDTIDAKIVALQEAGGEGGEEEDNMLD